jgi:hypothetical protein
MFGIRVEFILVDLPCTLLNEKHITSASGSHLLPMHIASVPTVSHIF